ncbi:MAG: proteasome accessory factor PafA2 family protein, partial [bacterium]
APMIQGTEHEYTLFSHKLNPRGIDPHRLALDLLWRSNLAAEGEFLMNGSRAYFDVGHLEIATCEVLTPRDVVLYEKAGERIVDTVRLRLEDAHNVKINAYKNNTDPDGVSYGSHENYCVPRQIPFPDAYLETLVPHLVSRMIYAGAGDFIDHQYVLSPCAYLTSQLVSGGNLSNTGVLHTRDEPHADPERFRRLHVIIGDALMSEPAILLRHFATQAILEAIHDGAVKDPPKLRNPLEDMWDNVESPTPDNWSFATKDGKRITPMQVQRYYLDIVEPRVDTPEQKQALKMWEEILDEFEGDFDTDKLARRIDWVARLREIERLKEIKGKEEFVELAACKQFGELSPSRGLYWRRIQDGLCDRVVTDDEVVKAMEQPPKTRAAARTEILTQYEVTTADWSEVRVLTEDGGTERLRLLDPYEWDPEVTT